MSKQGEGLKGNGPCAPFWHKPTPLRQAHERWKTVLQIMEQLERAARTMRHMPPAFRKQRMGYWPEIIRSHWEAQASAWDYEKGRWRKMGPPRITPTPRQITEMDEVIEWLTWIPGEKARVVWARAEKFSWRKTAAIVGKAPNTCKTIFRTGVYTINELYNHPERRKAKRPLNLPVQQKATL
jgi:hypothetical protein